MNHINIKWKNRIPTILFFLTLLGFLVFFCYMATEERVSVYRAEPTHTYTTLTDLELELVEDDTAPAGVRKIYRGVLSPELAKESCLLFNIAHHHIEVYFNDTLAYSLVGAEGNRIGANVSSNWCTVHVGQDHSGEDLTIVLTPLFEAAIEKTPSFMLGSDYAIAMELIQGELPLLVLSSLCILLGLFVTLVSLGFCLVLKSESMGTVYLGLFSIFIGLWKLTDLRCITLLFAEHSMALGYISVGALFLTGLCLLIYFSELFESSRKIIPLLLSCGGSLLCLTVLVMQVFGHTEIRQNLVFSHVLLITAICTIPLTALLNRLIFKSWGLSRSWVWLSIVFVGIAFDLLYYYLNNGNGRMSFSVMGLILYTLITFLKSVQASTRKAYTDSRTGLVNRTRWKELMSNERPTSDPYAILMIDMNGLKQVNDTLGHDVGDEMIYRLSEILRHSLPHKSVICHWGGDEFAVLLNNTNRHHLDHQVSKLFSACEQYNSEHPELPLSFAVGAVLSSDHPGISKNELFRLADEDMYRNKKRWYTQQANGGGDWGAGGSKHLTLLIRKKKSAILRPESRKIADFFILLSKAVSSVGVIAKNFLTQLRFEPKTIQSVPNVTKLRENTINIFDIVNFFLNEIHDGRIQLKAIIQCKSRRIQQLLYFLFIQPKAQRNRKYVASLDIRQGTTRNSSPCRSTHVDGFVNLLRCKLALVEFSLNTCFICHKFLHSIPQRTRCRYRRGQNLFVIGEHRYHNRFPQLNSIRIRQVFRLS